MKPIISITKHCTYTKDITEVRLLGVLVYKKHETFPDDRPRKIGFDALPSNNSGIVEDDDDWDEDLNIPPYDKRRHTGK